MPLFEVAIVELPNPKDAEEDGAMEKLIISPQFVIAKDTQAAALRVAMDPKNRDAMSTMNQDRMAVLTRPFAPQ